MNEPTNTSNERRFEERVIQAGKSFVYPPTPDIAASLRRSQRASRLPEANRRLTWALAILLVALAGLLFVPPVRAQVLEFLQIGLVKIFPGPPDQTPTPSPGSYLPQPGQIPATIYPNGLTSLAEIEGETDLEQARLQVDFPIRLPTYPASLGPPDRVFLQDQGDDALILVWLQPGDPQQVYLSLHQIGPASYALHKLKPITVEQTEVNGQPAAWTTGPYLLQLEKDPITITRLIEGHVLIWAEDQVTYRLETGLDLDEALKIAESLR